MLNGEIPRLNRTGKPHVCFISESESTFALLTGEECNKVGGAEVQQTLLASNLAKLGYPVSFLVPDFGQPAEITTEEGIVLVKIRPQSGRLIGLRFLDEIRRFFQAMNRANADVYYQRAGSPVTGIAALYCRLKGKPLVFSLASNMDLDGTWKTGLRPHYYKLFQYGVKHATVIVTQTDDQTALLRRNMHREGVLIRSTFARPPSSVRSANSRYILWVGNFWGVKRPAMFLELATRMPQYQFMMVGGAHSGEEHIFEEVSADARSIPNLQLTGAVPYSEVGKYFDGALVFVNTSSKEGFPNTYLQAWCRGIPVIATFDADGLIARYGLGRHCANLDELAAGVDELMRDDRLRTKTGERAASYVTDHHSPEVVTAQYDRLFTQLYKGDEPA